MEASKPSRTFHPQCRFCQQYVQNSKLQIVEQVFAVHLDNGDLFSQIEQLLAR